MNVFCLFLGWKPCTNMKYYLIAGEASGDLHASHLIKALRREDADASFRFIGGDRMETEAADSGTLVRHYSTLAYMGFIPVLMHLPTILRGMTECKKDIASWQPDVVILVDYAGFNLKIAKYVKKHLSGIRTFYYISPKIWAWKEYRIKDFKRYVDEMFCILPFEKEYFEKKHNYKVHYVGNPTADEVRNFKEKASIVNDDFLRHNQLLQSPNPIIAILPGSRQQEIRDNLPSMLEAVKPFMKDYRIVIAGAPGIEHEYYTQFTRDYDNVSVLHRGGTYQLLYNATAALVTSGTATLETAIFRVPQVVCYKTPLPLLMRWAFNHIIKCNYISLVNLIADREVVKELFADRFSIENIRTELSSILSDADYRNSMLKDYDDVATLLGDYSAPDNAARIMTKLINNPNKAEH